MLKVKRVAVKVFNFLYENWFVIPMVICLYGLSGDYQIMNVVLFVNFILWLAIGAIVTDTFKQYKKELGLLERKNTELFDELTKR